MMKMKIDKYGFIAIETIIIASLMLIVGGLGVSQHIKSEQNITNEYSERSAFSIGEGIKSSQHCYEHELGRISNDDSPNSTKGYKRECREDENGRYFWYKIGAYNWPVDESLDNAIQNGQLQVREICYIHENGRVRNNNGYSEICYMKHWNRYM